MNPCFPIISNFNLQSNEPPSTRPVPWWCEGYSQAYGLRASTRLAVCCSSFGCSLKKEGLVTVSCRVWCSNCFKLNLTRFQDVSKTLVKSYSDFLRNPLLLQHQSQKLNMMNPILFSLILFLSLFLYPNS